MILVQQAQRNWRDSGIAGVQTCSIWTGNDGDGGYLAKFQAGARFPKHAHDGWEQILVMEETLLFAAATRLFQQRGFNGLGMRQIAEHLQIKAPSLYHHFASKEDLTRHAPRRYREEQATRLLAIEDGEDLAEQLRMYAGLFAEMLHDGNRLCMYVTMVREPSFQEQGCVDELQLFAKQNIDWLEKILHAGKGGARLQGGCTRTRTGGNHLRVFRGLHDGFPCR
ncbi:TetR family transcriptional regulator [Rugamonas sp. A1-17]|nr:TetR family transcriptional regulator [Rugamonas sp. A1-17]